MKLVVGLGNPGRRYENTRHNLGYLVAEQVARRFGGGSRRAKFQGTVAEANIGGQQVLLLCPETYMNLSGGSVQEAHSFYKLALEELLVICDDLNLPLGKLRMRTGGTSGGQKGLEDIIRRLGNEQFPRLRIGIGPAPPGWVWSNFVLSKFTEQEKPVVNEAVDRAAQAVADWVDRGIDYCMSHYNG